MNYQLTREEQETILLTNEADDTMDIYTFNRPLKARLRKFAKECPDLITMTENDEENGSVRYVVQKDRVSINFVKPISKERQKELSERGKKNAMYLVKGNASI